MATEAKGPEVKLLVGVSESGEAWWFRHMSTGIALSVVQPVDREFIPVLRRRLMTADPMHAPGRGLYTLLEFPLPELLRIGFCQDEIATVLCSPMIEEFR